MQGANFADAHTPWRTARGKSSKSIVVNLQGAAVELAKDWRTDKILRRLEAFLVAADKEHLLLISGAGDVVEPDEEVIAIGSGGPMALASAKALLRHTHLSAREIAEISLKIASEICIYTNSEIIVEEL